MNPQARSPEEVMILLPSLVAIEFFRHGRGKTVDRQRMQRRGLILSLRPYLVLSA